MFVCDSYWWVPRNGGHYYYFELVASKIVRNLCNCRQNSCHVGLLNGILIRHHFHCMFIQHTIKNISCSLSFCLCVYAFCFLFFHFILRNFRIGRMRKLLVFRRYVPISTRRSSSTSERKKRVSSSPLFGLETFFFIGQIDAF